MNHLALSPIFITLVILLLLSAFFSGAETSMMSLNRYRLKHLRNKHHRGAQRAAKLLAHPERLISLILIGNNLVNFICASLFTVVAIRLWGETGIVLAPIIVTLVVLIVAEIMPKTVAARHPEAIAFPASAILLPLLTIAYPVVWLFNKFTHTLLRWIGIDLAKNADKLLSRDELRSIVGDVGTRISKRHQRMLLNILDLEKATIEDVMIPRHEIIGIDLNSDPEQWLNIIYESPFNHLPVYTNTIDKIEGVLHKRTLHRLLQQNKPLDHHKLRQAMNEPYFVPETTPLHTQLLHFQQNKRRLCMVVDEYGVVQGLATLEDILEEIVGELTSSDLQQENNDIVQQEDGSYLIHGSTTIRDINKTLYWNLPADGPKTLNGLLIEYLESFPDGPVGVKIDQYCFEVVTIKNHCITYVKGTLYKGVTLY